MKLEEWFAIYKQILSDFNFSAEEDEKSAKLMHQLGKGKLLDAEALRNRIEGKDVVVVGGAVDKEAEGEVIITAGKAILKWVKLSDRTPNIHVTDMEEPADLLASLEEKGTLLVLHAHGDNVDRIREVIPKVRRFIGTTQSVPFDKIYNFGGFTDGDRAAIIAKKFGARKITLHGFDFKAGGIKGRKLLWAKKILERERII